MRRDSGFDRFTDGARRVLTLAQAEAQRFRHGYIGTEHLLLGLVRERDGGAAKVLANLGIELSQVRSAVEFIIGRGDQRLPNQIGLTPRSKRVIELAVSEARRLNHGYIGTEHLLLGLLREGEGIAAGVLATLGVELKRVREETLRVLQSAPPTTHGAGFAGSPVLAPAPGPSVGRLRRVIPVAQTREFGRFTLTILSLESFETGFTVQMRLNLDPTGRRTLAQLDNLPFTATDDLTTQYSGGGGAPGSLAGMRTPTERWLSVLYTPSLDPDARELRLTVPEAWLAGQAAAATRDTAELRTFVITLAG